MKNIKKFLLVSLSVPTIFLLYIVYSLFSLASTSKELSSNCFYLAMLWKTDIFQKHLKKWTDIRDLCRNESGRYLAPITLAIAGWHIELIELLIDNWIDVTDPKESWDWTISPIKLISKTKWDKEAIVKLLVDKWYSENMRTTFSMDKDEEMLKILKKYSIE